ncbi:hypothetical protein NIES4071_23930 [Calothrix sp. NIES-4071]|nr:hypothetical protein NIES4071_23930 [Calothrix sp. NIES-4071]
MNKKINSGLLTICSSIPVIAAASASAKTVEHQHQVDDAKSDIVISIEEDDIPVFSPNKANSKPDELSMELGNVEERTAKDAKKECRGGLNPQTCTETQDTSKPAPSTSQFNQPTNTQTQGAPKPAPINKSVQPTNQHTNARRP